MEVKIERSFLKDLSKIKDRKTAQSVKAILQLLEDAETTPSIPALKKLKGHTEAYRIKTGDYRIGIFIKKKKIEVVRFLHRKDIYKQFP